MNLKKNNVKSISAIKCFLNFIYLNYSRFFAIKPIHPQPLLPFVLARGSLLKIEKKIEMIAYCWNNRWYMQRMC